MNIHERLDIIKTNLRGYLANDQIKSAIKLIRKPGELHAFIHEELAEEYSQEEIQSLLQEIDTVLP